MAGGLVAAMLLPVLATKDPTTGKLLAPCQAMTIARRRGMGWNKGTTVLLIDDADGNTWVMKGFQLGLKPQHTYERFVSAGAGNFRSLSAGWKFRIETLDGDLIERPKNGVATIMSDEFFNVYDKTAPGMTNYQASSPEGEPDRGHGRVTRVRLAQETGGCARSPAEPYMPAA